MDEKSLNRRQNLLILLCWLSYTSVYFGRYTYNSNITSIIDDFGVDHRAAGLVATVFFFAYGVGQVVHGILCSKYPKRYILPFSLFVSAIINLTVFFGAPFVSFKYLWLINAVVQSTLWPSIILVMSENLDAKHLNRAVLVMGTTSCAGTFGVYGMSSLFSSVGRYKLSFLTGAIVLIAVSLTWLFFYDPVGLGKPVPKKKEDGKQTGMPVFILFTIITFCVFAVVDNFVKDGMATWVPSMIKEIYHKSDSFSLAITTFLNLVGVICGAVAVGMSKLVKNLISLTSLMFGVCAVMAGAVLMFMRVSIYPVVIAFGMVMLFAHAICSVITGMGPLYMREYINSGKVSGIVNGCCYAGSSVSAYALGYFADEFGWDPVFIMFVSACAVMAVFGAIMRVAVFIYEKNKK